MIELLRLVQELAQGVVVACEDPSRMTSVHGRTHSPKNTHWTCSVCLGLFHGPSVTWSRVKVTGRRSYHSVYEVCSDGKNEILRPSDSSDSFPDSIAPEFRPNERVLTSRVRAVPV